MKNSWRSYLLALVVSLPAVVAGPGERAVAAQLVLFEGSWCPTCRHWNRTVAPGYAQNEIGRRAPLRRYEVGTPRPADIAKPHVKGVYGVPTFVVMEGGREVGRIEGFTGETQFWKRLDAILTRIPKTVSMNP